MKKSGKNQGFYPYFDEHQNKRAIFGRKEKPPRGGGRKFWSGKKFAALFWKRAGIVDKKRKNDYTYHRMDGSTEGAHHL